MKKALLIITCLLFLTLPVHFTEAQTQVPTEKEVITSYQFWISTNNVFIVSKRWGILNDIHIRRTNFLADPSFYFIRFGAQYWIRSNFTVAGGYAHLWLTNAENKWDRYTNENRIYQQLALSERFPGANLFLRVRNEQRFFNTIQNGESLNDNYFINRVRLLMSVSVPFHKGSRTRWFIADEVHLNFGQYVVFNTFNQNRLTIGITYKINEKWRFDTGYMMVFQQLSTGYQYNLNHTFRLFFYGNFDFRKDKSQKLELLRQADE